MDRHKSASSIKHEIMDQLKIAISSQTVRRHAYELGLHGCVTLKKPYLNKANRIKHLN